MTDLTGVATYRQNNRGGFDILARWNDKAKFRVIETLPGSDMAELFVRQLTNDDAFRRSCMNEAKGWDFVENKPTEKRQREPRERVEPVHFSFED